ncbi:MAG TPA: HAMP domain-containing sensor histidine kinase, partial [Sphingomonas sp.]|nr:HAMP domain-containing sensor histidine kinase [Sphingomonas sp.]
LGWGVVAVLVHGARLWMQRPHFPVTGDAALAGLWLKHYAWTALPIGFLWGALAIPIALGSTGTPFFEVCTVVIGMIAGATIVNYPYIPAMVAITWPMGFATALALSTWGDVEHLALAGFFLLSTAAATYFAIRMNGTLTETLLSRQERNMLTADLSARNAELARANERLGTVNTQLQETQAMAEAANKAKSEFLSNMSHELRTPLNAIIGFSEIIKDQSFGPVGQARYTEYANDIYESGRSLLQLINDILDLSKVEAGKMELQRTFVDVADAMGRCMRLIKDRANKSRVQLETVFDPSLPLLFADEVRLRQIGLNLLSNAVKFTPAGGKVTISTRVEQSGAIAIAVTDTGIGMNAADIKVALERFGQAASSLSRPYEGTGLGLPLTKAMVDLHGGHLDITSEPGKGTTVIVTFPPQQFPEASAHAAD